MENASPNQIELLELLERLLEDQLDAESASRLEELVLSDPAARWTYVQYLSIHAQLPRYNGAGFHLPSLHQLRDSLADKTPEQPALSPLRPGVTPRKKISPDSGRSI